MSFIFTDRHINYTSRASCSRPYLSRALNHYPVGLLIFALNCEIFGRYTFWNLSHMYWSLSEYIYIHHCHRWFSFIPFSAEISSKWNESFYAWNIMASGISAKSELMCIVLQRVSDCKPSISGLTYGNQKSAITEYIFIV